MWYYDRQGIIQVGGFDFVEEFPRFLVLLYALQRFELSDWGRNPAFTMHESPALDKIEKHTVAVMQRGKLFTWTLQPSSHHRLALKGRATAVMEASSDEQPEESMIAKLYWAEETRRSEVDIITMIKAFDNEPDIKGHVPDLHFGHEFPLSTATVRKQLRFDDNTSNQGSRTFRFLVFRKLQPITELQHDVMFRVWSQCVLCKLICLLLFLVVKVTSFKVTTPFGIRGSIIET